MENLSCLNRSIYIGRFNYTRAPLHGRLTPPATLARGRMQLINLKGAERKDPRFGANSDLIMPNAACVEQIALPRAVCLSAVSRSDRQYGCNLRAGGNMGTERDEMKKRKEKKRVHTQRVLFVVLLYARNKALRSTTQHRSAGQGTTPCRTAPHGAALRCWAI